jgi:AraC-like DNA-binding protein
VHAHDARSLGVVGLACKTVPTVAEAMSCHARYQHLTNRSARYAHDLHDDTLRITQTRVGPPSLGRQLMTVFTFLVAVELLEVVSGARPQVRALRVQHRLDAHERRAIAQLIDAPVIENDASNRLDVDAAILQRPTVSADAELREHFLSLLEQAAPGLSEATPFIAQVRTVVDAALVHGEPNLEATARLCGMSGRTLQRRLTEAHTTFAAVVDDARRQRAVAYLDNPQLSLSEVAWLLGYAEHSSFFRAFKRWFDTTPQQWRARHG